MLLMTNKVFWITGGGSGIGSQLAIKLAKLGNTVIKIDDSMVYSLTLKPQHCLSLYAPVAAFTT